MHSENGTRVGCGILERVAQSNNTLVAATESLTDTRVTSDVTALIVKNTVCFYGAAINLERNLQSFLDGGSDCMDTNGCGAHLHSGYDCANETTQEGHHYNAGKVGALLGS